jgi:VCBS repeat-containing protein
MARDDSYTTDENTSLNIPAPGILENDTDPDEEDTLTAILLSSPSNGSLALGSDGSFTYTPDAGFTGTDSFTYRASDGLAESNEATATINVSSANNPPTAAFSWVDGGKMKAEFTDLSTDDGTIVSWSWDFGDGKSNAAQNPKHKYHSAGPHTVTLTVTDDGGLTATTTQTINF